MGQGASFITMATFLVQKRKLKPKNGDKGYLVPKWKLVPGLLMTQSQRSCGQFCPGGARDGAHSTWPAIQHPGLEQRLLSANPAGGAGTLWRPQLGLGIEPDP